MITRFAPSPTGPLHLGHAFSALVAHDMARAARGRFLLRIEDIDRSRCRPEWEQQIHDDLRWLGITWDGDVMRQSSRLSHYAAALDQLWRAGLLYPCTCNRRDIQAASQAPQEGAPIHGPDGVIYPGTCRTIPFDPHAARPRHDVALRLNIAKAVARLGGTELGFEETGTGPLGQTGWIDLRQTDFTATLGDVVLARRDMGTSYHLSVVLDDAAQGVSDVIRGADLFEATQIHVLLQELLALPRPRYHHHRLIRDATGKRLAKRDDARAIAKYRAEGASPNDIRAMVGL